MDPIFFKRKKNITKFTGNDVFVLFFRFFSFFLLVLKFEFNGKCHFRVFFFLFEKTKLIFIKPKIKLTISILFFFFSFTDSFDTVSVSFCSHCFFFIVKFNCFTFFCCFCFILLISLMAFTVKWWICKYKDEMRCDMIWYALRNHSI